jgi:hypothetical protein
MSSKRSGASERKSHRKKKYDDDKDDQNISASQISSAKNQYIKVEYDGLGAEESMPWHVRYTTFDFGGDKSSIFTVFDDGRLRAEKYISDGSRFIIHYDNTENGDGFEWNTIFTVRDPDDDRIFQQMLFDDSDVRFYQFAENDITRRLDIDFDNTDPWLAREYIYDDQGNKIDTQYYYDLNDVAELYHIDEIPFDALA